MSDIERALTILDHSAAYPTEGARRRTDDGYPMEIVYDEFSYKRMVDTYREALRAAAEALRTQPTPTNPNSRSGVDG